MLYLKLCAVRFLDKPSQVLNTIHIQLVSLFIRCLKLYLPKQIVNHDVSKDSPKGQPQDNIDTFLKTILKRFILAVHIR